MPRLPLIQLTNVRRVFRKGRYEVAALDGITLTIEQGEFVSVMGPSGSGKSTLMHQLGCLDRPTEGTYALHGVRVEQYTDRELSAVRNRFIGFVFQDAHLLSEAQLVQNVALPLVYSGVPRRDRVPIARNAAEAVGLGDRVTHRPTELSGGEVQRVAIARALVTEPDLILADEPTGNLDSKTGLEIMAIFEQMSRLGKTIVMVTHDLRLARFAERIIHLTDGRIVKEETVHERVHSGIELPNVSFRHQTGEAADESDGSPGARLGRSGPPDKKAPPISGDDGQSAAGLLGADAVRHMGALDVLRVSVREGLLSHKLRTLLTMLGVLFGVAAVICMMAIGAGAQEEALQQFREMGVNNIRVRALEREGQTLIEDRRKGSLGLSVEDADMIRRLCPAADSVVPMKWPKLDVRRRDKKLTARVVATTPDYPAMQNFYVREGRFLEPDDLAEWRQVCVLGRKVKEDLFGNERAIGRRITIGLAYYTVIGVMEGKGIIKGEVEGVSERELNRDIYIPLTTALKRIKKDKTGPELDEVVVAAQSPEAVRRVSAVVQAVLRKQHHDAEDFQLIIPQEKLEQMQRTSRNFTIILATIASISLLVGGIGIMNIMLATVTERTREIGTRRAVGACQSDVIRQFLAEAVAISVSGGVIGVLIGWSGSFLIGRYAEMKTIVTPMALAISFVVAVTVGIIFGLYPAWQAALQDPIEALRYE